MASMRVMDVEFVARVFTLVALLCRPVVGSGLPQITPPPVLNERNDGISNPAFEGYTSDFGSWSAIYCNSGSTFKTFGTIADCCTTAGNCNPATECFAGELLYFDDGSASTCEGGCDTGYIYKTMNDPAPRSMYGCFDQFDLYRTINAAAMSSTDGTSTDGSSPSSTLSSASSNTSTSTPLQGSKHTAIIAAAVVVVVVLLAAIAGLVTWILLLKRKQRKQTVPTELRPMPSDSNTAFETKAELASKEISTAELPSPLTNPNVPYSSTTSPVSSIQKQPDWQKYTPQPDTMELPAYSVRGNYQELPG